MDSSVLKIGVISTNFISSSNVELVIATFAIVNKNSLHISILSFKREEEMLPDGHDTLVLLLKFRFAFLQYQSIGN